MDLDTGQAKPKSDQLGVSSSDVAGVDASQST